MGWLELRFEKLIEFSLFVWGAEPMAEVDWGPRVDEGMPLDEGEDEEGDHLGLGFENSARCGTQLSALGFLLMAAVAAFVAAW